MVPDSITWRLPVQFHFRVVFHNETVPNRPPEVPPRRTCGMGSRPAECSRRQDSRRNADMEIQGTHKGKIMPFFSTFAS